MTVYDLVRKCMSDPEFNRGGILKNERKYLDAIGFEYTVKDGCITNYCLDLEYFYHAMTTLHKLNEKYSKST